MAMLAITSKLNLMGVRCVTQSGWAGGRTCREWQEGMDIDRRDGRRDAAGF